MTQVTPEEDTGTDQAVWRGWPVRTRVLVLMLALMAGGLAVAGAVTYSVQFAQLEERIDAELLQEREELQQLGEAGPLGDGAGYADLNDLFFDFIQDSVAGRYESMMAIIDGRAVWESGGQRPFDITQPAIRQVALEAAVPGESVFREVPTAQTDLRVMVTSVILREAGRHVRLAQRAGRRPGDLTVGGDRAERRRP